jgi:hypothetical protein
LEGDAIITIGTDGFGTLSDTISSKHWIPPTEDFPIAHTLHSVAPSSSVYFFSVMLQDSQMFDPLTLANFPLSQILQSVAPFGDVFPGGHLSQLRRPLILSVMPLVPAGHGKDFLHTPSVEQSVACQPSEMLTEDTPPAEIVPASGL